MTLIQMAAHKQKIKKYYDKKVNLRHLKMGAYVLAKYILSISRTELGKARTQLGRTLQDHQDNTQMVVQAQGNGWQDREG